MEESEHWYEEQTSFQLTNVPCDRVLRGYSGPTRRFRRVTSEFFYKEPISFINI